jgi:glutamate racemase
LAAGTHRELPIAVFDSGIGGLTYLHEFLVSLPEEDYVYLGDTAFFPYGTKSREELRPRVSQLTGFLLERGAKLLVIACNAATSAAADAAREVASARDVVVLTVVDPEAEVAAPDLAPIIQHGFPFDQSVVDTVRSYCAPLKRAEIDTLILGCTHYPLVAPMLQRILGRDVRLVTAGHAVSAAAQRVLEARDLASPDGDEGTYRFLCTGDVAAFRELGTRFLQMPLGEVEHVEVPDSR